MRRENERFDLNLSDKETNCVDMITSFYVYGYAGNSSQFIKSHFSDDYKKALGEEKVRELFDKQYAHLRENFDIVRDVYTDSEGGSYNSLVAKVPHNE